MVVANTLAYYDVHAVKGFVVHVLAGVLYGLLSIRFQPCQQILDLGLNKCSGKHFSLLRCACLKKFNIAGPIWSLVSAPLLLVPALPANIRPGGK